MRKLGDIDRVGLGWRAELAPGILVNLDRIDLVEVMADDFFRADARKIDTLVTLAVQVPVTYHGVGLGLASSHPVCEKHLSKLASLLHRLGNPHWSEHLAFVRAGKIELGHLGAPPRNEVTLEGLLKNLARVKAACGSLPALENVATLLEPPGSVYSEAEYHSEIFRRSGARFLLDLHNLYANCVNFGRDPFAELSLLPLSSITGVHLSGGHWIPEPSGLKQRLLDDHVHGVPPEVFLLLEKLATLAPQPLDVIIERDGRYPPMHVLLLEIEKAREALRRGREHGDNFGIRLQEENRAAGIRNTDSTSPHLETFLARLYTQPRFLDHFLAHPMLALETEGKDLTQTEKLALVNIDRAGLVLAARSFGRKRQKRAGGVRGWLSLFSKKTLLPENASPSRR